MDIAVIARRAEKKRKLEDLDESDEINACNIVVNIDMAEEMRMGGNVQKGPCHHQISLSSAACLGGAARSFSGRSCNIRL